MLGPDHEVWQTSQSAAMLHLPADTSWVQSCSRDPTQYRKTALGNYNLQHGCEHMFWMSIVK